MNKIKVTVNPGKEEFFSLEKTSLLKILEKLKISITTPCGGNGTCGKCKVIVFPEQGRLSDHEKKWLSPEEIKRGFRLACQCSLLQDSVITIPQSSLLTGKSELLKNKKNWNFIENPFKINQKIEKYFIQLSPPTLSDQISDWSRIQNSLAQHTNRKFSSWQIPADLLGKVPALLRENDFSITITLWGNRVISIDPGDTRRKIYGLAFDIGTTTIGGYLVDLTNAQVIVADASMNPQSIFGDDVISRIGFAQRDPDHRGKLQLKLIERLNQMIQEFIQKAEINLSHIYESVFVGNTCMHHFFWDLPTENLALAPYIPVITDGMTGEAKDLVGYCPNPHSRIYTAPNISAYVGGDIVADIIDTDLWKNPETTLLVDLGTNGEIVLFSDHRFWSCSAAAGPAFEGARISSGMRATEGAIDSVKTEEQILSYHVIGEGKASGFCGSGIVDLIAELLKLQVIQADGRLIKPDENTKIILSPNLRERIVQVHGHSHFLVVPAEDSDNGLPIYLTQKDIREVQLAKGAIAAGIKILLREAGVEKNQIDKILLAGSFGNILNISSALKLKMIPGIPSNQIFSVGNAAGQGAVKLLLSQEMRKISREIGEKVCYIELSSQKDFQEIFSESLFFYSNSQ